MDESENKENISETDMSKNQSTRSRMPVRKQLLVLTGVLAIMFTLGGATAYFGREKTELAPTEVVPGNMVFETRDDEEMVKFSDLDILAKSAFVFDVQSGQVLFQKAPDTELPLASIAKLMTALVAKEIVEEGTVVPITADALKQSGDNGLLPGELFSYKKLSDLVLLVSSNDGAYALASAAGAVLDAESPESAFVKAMNVRARELGLSSTSFRNPTGLDISDKEAGSYGTAREVAELMAFILENYPELLEETLVTNTVIGSASGETHAVNNTNRVVGEIAKVIGSKTGYTTLAGGNLVMAFDAGLARPIVAVVLGSSYQGRFSDMVQLVEATLNEINSQNQ